jgi:acyl-CoA reductase-like NAD-dependent aldehyde dehydrogenase
VSQPVERLLLVDGEWIATGSWTDVYSPFSGELVGRVANGDAQIAARAIDAAAGAMRTQLPPFRRAELLERTASILEQRADDTANLICAEAGKPIKSARIEAARAVTTFKAAATEARMHTGEVVPLDSYTAARGKIAFSIRVPIGVVGAISPFNFPLNLVAHKVAPALAAGCSVVLKPAEKTPLSALLLAELIDEAGWPPGWLNVVCGDPSRIGDVLIHDDRVKLITFTGSSPVGWGIASRAPNKRVTLELGNSSPVIVTSDGNLEHAAQAIALSAYSFAGQSCVSAQRVYVERPIFSAFTELFLQAVDTLRVGDPQDEYVDVGPVIDATSRNRLLNWIHTAVTDGAELLAGGTANGNVVAPTVLTNAPEHASVIREEAFGPVCSLQSIDSLEQALRFANATPFGLQAGIFTSRVDTALTALQRLDVGCVTVNEAPSFRADNMPYGGTKHSGNTREGPRYAIREMTESRLLVLDPGF